MKSMTLKILVLILAVFLVLMKPTAPLPIEDDNDIPNFIKCTKDAQCYIYGLHDCKMIPQYVADDLPEMFSVCVVHNMCRWDSWGRPEVYANCWDYYGKPDRWKDEFAPEY